MKYIKNFFEQFIILIQFMTRIPIPIKVDYSEKKLGKSIKFFPNCNLFKKHSLQQDNNCHIFNNCRNYDCWNNSY